MNLKKYIPNTITSMNLLCGAVGVIFTMRGNLALAFPLMIAAAVFDFADGLAARALGAYSDIGKELDSLCDAVSFGLLPALMLHQTMISLNGESFYSWTPLLIAVFSALRLAKFNVDSRQHDSFIGLPTPACAMICGSLAYAIAADTDSAIASMCANNWLLPLLSLILSALLVCELPMFAFKFGKGKSTDRRTRIQRICFIVCSAVIVALVALTGLNWSLAVALIFVSYIAVNVVSALV
ncbi:MAG: CDP-diacylglycerol--serine O-phosphatidyltransferase [Rikenellaceae bacterium]|nr:CDP-diacylglycerol--serine O-phosphatidyltransferase [Rikenellaceae bacterium]